jgi:V/A-type H+-transporting ATPase subunit K
MEPSVVVSTGSAFGLALGLLGGGLAFSLGGAGSAIGVGLAGMTASGVITEDPGKFGKLIPFIGIPGTQGIYGFITFFIITAMKLNMLGTPILPTIDQGYQLLFIGGCSGFVQFVSAIHQGKVSAAAIGIVARKPEESGKALILPAFVETYAVIALVASLLIVFFMKIG